MSSIFNFSRCLTQRAHAWLDGCYFALCIVALVLRVFKSFALVFVVTKQSVIIFEVENNSF